MRRLIIEEYKKLFKKKSVLILTILTVVCTLGICYKEYFGYDFTQFIGKVYDLDGEKLKGLELLKVRDQTLHKYAGEWSREKEKQIQFDLSQILKKYPQNQLDEKAMEENYGKDWKIYLEKEKNGTLDQNDIDKMTREGNDIFYITDENENIILDKHFIDEKKREYYIYAYYGRVRSPVFDSLAFDNWNSLLFPQDEIIAMEKIGNKKLSLTQQQAYQEKTKKSLLELPHNFDSPVPNERILNTLSWVYILPIFVIMIILSSLFSIERECKTDQIIYPTKMNKQHITLAKLFVGYSSAISIVWLQFIIVFIFSMIFLPAHEWNMAAVDLGMLSQQPIFPTTYYNLLIHALLLPTFAAIAIATITMFLSYVLKRKFIVIIILFIYMIAEIVASLMFGFHISNIWYAFIKFMHPLQMSIYDIYFQQSMILSTEFPYLMTTNMFIPIKNIVMIVWCIISVIFILGLWKLSKRQYIYE